jgi:hypothetical protein
VFTFTLAVGLVVVAAVSLSPLLVGDRLPRGLGSAGAGLVAAALILAVPTVLVHGAAASRDKTFIAAFVLLLAGALLIVGSGDDDRREPGADDDDPSWWPSFELDFWAHVHARRQLTPRPSRR